MELNIPDLLDGLQDESVSIQPCTQSSTARIKELTMNKIHKYEKPKGRGLSFITKMLVAAIIIATLAIPVMAAGGFTFKDWLTGPGGESIPETVPKEVSMELSVASKSSSLVAYNYHLLISDENVTARGLTYLCEEYCVGTPIGSLTTTDGYWLEKWDGTQFLPMEGKYEGSTQIQIEDDGSYRWEINWEDVYGTLDTGAYHLGKVYTLTTPDGLTTDYTVYVYFRIYTEEMASYVSQINTALESNLTQNSYHLTETHYDVSYLGASYYTTELWKYGENYLSETRYCKEDGTLLDRRGAMLRDGVGYTLDWTGDTITSAVAFWEQADYLIPETFTIWDSLLSFNDAKVGQVYVEDNCIYFYEYDNWIDETKLTPEQIRYYDIYKPTWNHDYTERAYHLNEAGNITKVTLTYMLTLDPATADPYVNYTMEFQDTAPEEIAAIINMQDVSKPNIFSWEDDMTGHYTKLAQFDGFVNTSPISRIPSAQDAIQRAKAEANPEDNPKYRDGYNYNMTNVWYDPDADIWKVRFYHSQDPYFQTIVWMNENGVTQMKSLSSHEFID